MLSDDQRKLLTTGLAVVAACALAWYLLVDHNPPRQRVQVARQIKRVQPPDNRQQHRSGQSTDQPQALRPLPPPMLKPRPRPMNQLENPATRPTAMPQEETEALEIDPVTPPEPQVPVELARAALGFVGADADAEQVWYAAINDPNMPANTRQDLIEDLNEDGFPNPRQITEDDLPLIYSRIALIEQVAPDAMDEVNAAAFAEAYKDLVNMVMRLEAEAIAREEAQAAGEDIPGPTPRRAFRR